MERSAAALKAGGNTLNESLGLIVSGNIIQQDAETTAAALKVEFCLHMGKPICYVA